MGLESCADSLHVMVYRITTIQYKVLGLIDSFQSALMLFCLSS